MNIIIIAYVGIAQSLFSIFLLFRKSSTKIADYILCIWLLGLASLFVLDIIKEYRQITEIVWPVSVNISLTFPPLLYLYTKYIIKKYMRFGKWDYCHFIPSCVGMIIIALFYIPYRSDINNFFSYAEFYGKMTSLRAIFGYVLYISLWIYVLLTLTRIYQHKKQIVNTYSFESVKISLNWLLFITVFYLVYFHYTILHYTILIAIFQINNYRIDYIENPGNPISLLIIYVLSYYGLRQQQLNIEWGGHLLNTHVEKQDHGDNRYTKSGLKENQAEIYLKQLISYMEQSQAWKDLELSVAKLSKQTNIPRHYITQTLNEYLHKNFYTFVNEYRIEYAMELIRSPKYKNWSLLAIAYESGFNSKTAFNNFFKKYTRMTPSEFKKSVNSDPL